MNSMRGIERLLETSFVGHPIHYFEVLNSTNTVAKELAEKGASEGTTVIADYQAAGRGRFNRKWYGEPGKNLLASVILRPRESEAAHLITYLAAVSAASAAEEETKNRVECKWPNDLLINGRKICGILLESSWQESAAEYLVVGIGMNVNEDKFPPDLQAKATSLKKECNHEVDRAKLLARLLQHFEANYVKSKSNGYESILASWRSRCPMFGKEITVEQLGRKSSGRAVRLDNDGALIMENDDQEIKLYAGNVTVSN